ncbi:hypothetical protein [Streptomyces californicus]|uniref:hypothetical protein n=1 Tax=Streptomyces californicus TaxID=67351 RepID=UPI00368582FA
MRQEWSPEDVVACWTLVDGDWDLVANKTGPTRLGFCLMLKFFELEGRFPEFTALLLSNINPYGTLRLEMDKRLGLAPLLPVPRPRTPVDASDQAPAEPR